MLTTEEKLKKLKEETSSGEDISIINLIDCLVEKAHDSKVSDIHIDPEAGGVRVRFRVDGVLQEAFKFPKKIHGEIISRIKVLSKLRSDEHQATQDGRFRHTFPKTG
jgi:type IV pilus assembly protein PilB